MLAWRKEQPTIEHSMHINASAESVWRHITEVDIASFRHPTYFSLLGIPKPLRAEVVEPGVRLVLGLFQRYLLSGIKANAERQEMTVSNLSGAPRA